MSDQYVMVMNSCSLVCQVVIKIHLVLPIQLVQTGYLSIANSVGALMVYSQEVLMVHMSMVLI